MPTGIENSIAKFLPEPIYIAAVKDLKDDVKSKESATFGKLLGILMRFLESSKHFETISKSFTELHSLLNVVREAEQVTDNRIDKLQNIEKQIGTFLKENFPKSTVEIDIPKIHLRSKFGVKEYPKPVGLANKYGFGAPILWPKKHEAPAVVLAAIKIALPELKTEFNEKQIAALDSAVEKLGSLPDFSDITASENTILSFADGNFALTT